MSGFSPFQEPSTRLQWVPITRVCWHALSMLWPWVGNRSPGSLFTLKNGNRGGTTLLPKSAAPFWISNAMFILSFFLGGGSPAPGRPDPGAEGHPPHRGRHGATDRRAATPHSRVLLGSSEAAPTVWLTSLAPPSMRSYRQGGVHRPARVASSLAGGSRFKRLVRPQQLYLRSGPRPGARPRRSESDRGAPVPGLTLSRFPSALRIRRHGVRVSEGQQGTPAASLHHPPGAPGHSPLQALERYARHSLRWRPRRRADPGPQARRDAVSPAAILGDLSIRSRPAFTARAALTPVPEVSSMSGS
ncbi:hypothetical protein NDU88_004422 [Pleurodeles waltl]|uniref:Uncharacterized protein n=1 Tax=Pleurodeles waltl TaxID=8319 RepID=A0AAV7W4Y9_PLEWA|nr:hypothetical protein NDU88_004422 [Pleurodeles waltl]